MRENWSHHIENSESPELRTEQIRAIDGFLEQIDAEPNAGPVASLRPIIQQPDRGNNERNDRVDLLCTGRSLRSSRASLDTRPMTPSLATMVGVLAAIASTISFLPQAVKIIRTRDTEGISTGTYAVTVAAFVLWITYGILLGAVPLIASNAVSLLLSTFILLMKLLPRPEKEKVAKAMQPLTGAH